MSDYTVHKADIENIRSEINAIRSSNLSVGVDDNYLWKYEESPYGKAECWVAYHKPSGEYVGAASLYPRTVYVNGAAEKIWVAGDFSVNRDHRGTGLALKMLRLMEKDLLKDERFIWLYTVPNQKSRPLLYKTGFKKLGMHHKFVKVVTAEYVYKKTKFGNTKIKNTTLSAVLNAGIRILSRESRYSRLRGISASCVDTFDARFDALCETARSQYHIIGERTERFLRWRYSDRSGTKFRIFTLCRDGELIGYIVFHVSSQSVYIVDILCHRDQVVADALIAEFSRFCRESGYESIHAKYFGSRLYTDVLRRYNFYVRDKDPDEILIYARDNTDMTELLKEENWHFVKGDSD